MVVLALFKHCGDEVAEATPPFLRTTNRLTTSNNLDADVCMRGATTAVLSRYCSLSPVTNPPLSGTSSPAAVEAARKVDCGQIFDYSLLLTVVSKK